MGEARRKKLAGYVPESKPKQEHPKKFAVGHVDMGSTAAIVAMLMAAKYRGRIPR